MLNSLTYSDKIDSDIIFVLPVFNNEFQHYIENKIIYFLIYEIDSKKQYIVNNPDLLSNKKVYTLDIRLLLSIKNITAFSINIHNYLHNQKLIDIEEYYTPAHTFYYKYYRELKQQNIIIPIVKWFELFDNIVRDIDFNKINSGYSFSCYNDMQRVLYEIEKNGLCVDASILSKYFNIDTWTLTNNIIHTQYNPFTLTGRPSNAFGGINFAALNKENGCRKAFVSRYGQDGVLVEFDYRAFHLRILGQLIGYDFTGIDDIHIKFAQDYFNKTFITEDEYNKSKEITFRKLYGGDRKYDNDFFKQVRLYTQQLYDQYKENGYIKSKITERELKIEEDSNSYKILNYSIQMHEMEIVMTILKKLFDYFNNNTIYNTTKLVLYTYDGLLFDCYKDEQFQEKIKQIENILCFNNLFPVKIKMGTNYDF